MVDFNKKILINMKKNLIKPVGGPRGYIYNLKSFFDQHNVKNIHYVDENIDNQNAAIIAYHNNNSFIKDKILKPLRNFWCYGLPIIIPRSEKEIDSGNYDVIHFHTTLEMYKNRKSLKKYKGIVVLTSHTPMVTHQEILMMLTPAEKKFLGFIYNRLPIIDEYAFNRANYIIFPCKEAEEPYYHTWNRYNDIKAKNKNKYKYLLTGIEECKAQVTRADIRAKYQIPNNAFVFCYVGRHNSVKGYDRLKEQAKKILSMYKDVYFLIAGKEEPLVGLKHKHWKEVGWTNDPHSIIAASNVFILPNTETYFDLVLLEVLSLGVPVLASNTGGNKFFFGNSGIVLFENDFDLYKKMQMMMEISSEELNEMGKNNRLLFETKFTKNEFGYNYIKLINSLCK